MTATTPRVSMVAAPPGSERPESLEPLRDFVRASGLRSLVVGASRDPNAKITILLVPPRGRRPVLAVKAPTTDLAARAVSAEERTLRRLAAHGAGPALSALPRAVGALDFEGRRAVVMTALDGIPMTTSYMRRRHTASHARVHADLAAVADWLGGFQRETAVGAGPLEMDSAVSTRLSLRFADDPQLPEDIERLAEAYGALRSYTVPCSAVHGDLWLGNVLLSRGRVSGIVDWEAGSTLGQPLRDVVRFAHMYALYLDRRVRPGGRVPGHRGLRSDGFGAGLEFALRGSGWFPDAYRGFIRGGLARLGAAPSVWRQAALAGIAEVAALTDDPEFARRNLELFRRLAGLIR